MEDSILKTVKKVLGLAADYDAFDTDILMHINAVFFSLHQLGLGPTTGFTIDGDEETWSEYIQDKSLRSAVKTYVYLRVRMLFDPPATSFTQDAMNKQIEQLEWRLNVEQEGRTHPWTDPLTSSLLTTE